MNRTVRNTASVLGTTMLTALAVYAAVRFGGAAVSPELASASALTCPATGCTATSCHATEGGGYGRGGGSRWGGM